MNQGFFQIETFIQCLIWNFVTSIGFHDKMLNFITSIDLGYIQIKTFIFSFDIVRLQFEKFCVIVFTTWIIKRYPIWFDRIKVWNVFVEITCSNIILSQNKSLKRYLAFLKPRIVEAMYIAPKVLNGVWNSLRKINSCSSFQSVCKEFCYCLK